MVNWSHVCGNQEFNHHLRENSTYTVCTHFCWGHYARDYKCGNSSVLFHKLVCWRFVITKRKPLKQRYYSGGKHTKLKKFTILICLPWRTFSERLSSVASVKFVCHLWCIYRIAQKKQVWTWNKDKVIFTVTLNVLPLVHGYNTQYFFRIDIFFTLLF